jgi:hypothetical protein
MPGCTSPGRHLSCQRPGRPVTGGGCPVIRCPWGLARPRSTLRPRTPPCDRWRRPASSCRSAGSSQPQLVPSQPRSHGGDAVVTLRSRAPARGPPEPTWQSAILEQARHGVPILSHLAQGLLLELPNGWRHPAPGLAGGLVQPGGGQQVSPTPQDSHRSAPATAAWTTLCGTTPVRTT